MTPTQVQDVLDYIYHVNKDTGAVTGLWPNSHMTAQQLQTLGERLSRIDITVEQAQRVLQEQWATTRKGPYCNTPDPNAILGALRNVAYGAKKQETQTRRGNRLIDHYRKRFSIPPDYNDTDACVYVARQIEPQWGVSGARTHLREMLSEFITEPVKYWSIVFQHYPHEHLQAIVRERIRKASKGLKPWGEKGKQIESITNPT